MKDSIEVDIELKAPISRVWKAITDHEEFGAWFQVKLDAPFAVGEMSTGYITYPGYEHMKWEAMVTEMRPEKLFSFRWCPYSDVADNDYSNEPTTRVEFTLEPTSTGTRLRVTESGFAALPDGPRSEEAMRRNSGGWSSQAENIASHIDG